VQGNVLYVENVYSKSANCLGQGSGGTDDDDGLIRLCMDNAFGGTIDANSSRIVDNGGKSQRSERRRKRLEKEAARWGRKVDVSKKAATAAAKPAAVQNVGAKAAYIQPDATTEYFKLDFAYILKGTIYADDFESGTVKVLGQVQIVEDLQFRSTDLSDPINSVVKVKGYELPANALVIDCTEVEFKWSGADSYYN
jgi:hypothetical protein